MKTKGGISYYIFCNDNERMTFLKKLISENDNIISFNLPIKCTFEHKTYFKDKKIAKMKGFRRFFANLFYYFISDIEVKIELETYSESSNKKLMCIKDFIQDTNKLYVIGTMGFGYSTINYILNYLLSEKKMYRVLVISLNNFSNKDYYYENLNISDIEKIKKINHTPF